ncbi:DUF6886 family protein [Caulobacter sp. DWR1-3-2b1]|uniref:DUF6886 family protein n=1 Tax=Caulobacter sp. DWR1-3-2b1 TaxID=2804670 RepID=UPI003CEA8E71
MQLAHFSDDPNIGLFEPRPVRVAVDRPVGQDWLNGPLVWAIDQPHRILYLFPRECPRIVVWPTPETTEEDRLTWMGETCAQAVAYVESSWMDRLKRAVIHRYAMPPDGFEDTREIGMWASRSAVRPSGVEALANLPAQLAEHDVELRPLERLTSLRPIWNSTLHASGVRLRNAVGWGEPGWPHSVPAGGA